MKEYHSVILPLEDVYALGGKEVFESFRRKKDEKRNLIILPSTICEKIYMTKKTGGAEALDFLKRVDNKKILENSSTIIYELNEGVDVAYISLENSNRDKNILNNNLKDKIKKISNNPIKIITRNSNDHLFYSSKGFDVEEPGFLMINSSIVYEGIIEGSDELYGQLYQKSNGICLDDAENILGRKLYPNQFIKFMGKRRYEFGKVNVKINRNKDGTKITGISDLVVKLLNNEEYSKNYKIGTQRLDNFFEIYPRNMEQYLAVQHGILNQNNEIVFLTGSQGSGKTILGYTTSVALILKYNKNIREKMGLSDKESFFKQIVLLKPNNPMGGKERDEGYLPGTLWEKINPRLQPFIDAHEESSLDIFPFKEMILHPKRENDFGKKRDKKVSDLKLGCLSGYLPPKEAIKLTSSAYLKGPTFTDTLVLVDEAQDFTPLEMKTIISRLGAGSKCIIMGDPFQVDNERCSKDINGLTSAIKHFLPKPQTTIFCLTQNFRIQSSEDALSWKVYR